VPVTLDTLTIAPLRAIRWGAASRIRRKTARRFTSSIVSHAASLVCSIVPLPMMPAALISTSIAPNRSTAAATMRRGASVAVTSAASGWPVPTASCRLDDGSQRLFVAPNRHDRGA